MRAMRFTQPTFCWLSGSGLYLTLKWGQFSFFPATSSNQNTVPVEVTHQTAHSVRDCALFSLLKSLLLAFFVYRYDEIWIFEVKIPHIVSLRQSVRYTIVDIIENSNVLEPGLKHQFSDSYIDSMISESIRSSFHAVFAENGPFKCVPI